MKSSRFYLISAFAISIFQFPIATFADTTTTSSTAGCQALVQAAATGLAADLKADDETIKQPESVTKFTCLDNFFSGAGLDIITSGLDLTKIATEVAGKICTELQTEWTSLEGTAQCGLSVTGLDTNFNLGLGGGSFCPTLNLGDGGDSLISAGTNTQGNTSWDVQGNTQLPDGYSLSLIGSNTGMSTVEP